MTCVVCQDECVGCGVFVGGVCVCACGSQVVVHH